MRSSFVFIGKIALLCVMSIVSSCAKNTKHKYAVIYNKLYNNPVLFYDSAVFVNPNFDTVRVSLDGDVKIVNYIDSIGCLGCRLKLSEWNAFMNCFNGNDN